MVDMISPVLQTGCWWQWETCFCPLPRCHNSFPSLPPRLSRPPRRFWFPLSLIWLSVMMGDGLSHRAILLPEPFIETTRTPIVLTHIHTHSHTNTYHARSRCYSFSQNQISAYFGNLTPGRGRSVLGGHCREVHCQPTAPTQMTSSSCTNHQTRTGPITTVFTTND